MYAHFLQYLKYIWHIYQIVINTWKIGRYFGEIMNLKYKCSTVNMNIFLSMVECSRLSTSLWHGNLTPKAPMCFLHDTQFIFVSALVVANNLFQRLSHHLALTQPGQQNGAQSMLDQCSRRINHRVFFSKYLIKHGGK